jgi:hypothetical protein
MRLLLRAYACCLAPANENTCIMKRSATYV